MNIRTISDWASAPAFALTIFAACSSSPAERHLQAESAYGAELQACVANSASRVESDVCADKVRARWTLKDGGK